MNHAGRIFWIVVLGFMSVIATAQAGKIEIVERIYPVGSNWPAALTGELQALKGINLVQSNGAAKQWDWNLVDATTLYVTVRLQANRVADKGFEFYDYIFRVPSSFESRNFKYAAVLSKQEHDASPARQFIGDAKATKGAGFTTENLSRLSHRARIIFRGRVDELRNKRRKVKKLDIRVAYWLLFTARELYEAQFILFDNQTEEARIWLTKQIQKRPNLFVKSTVPRKDAESLIADTSLVAMERGLFEHLTEWIKVELFVNKYGVRECGLARKLWKELKQKPPLEYSQLTNRTAMGFHMLWGIASCIEHEIQKNSSPASELRKEGKIILSSLKKVQLEFLPETRKKLKIDLTIQSLSKAIGNPD